MGKGFITDFDLTGEASRIVDANSPPERGQRYTLREIVDIRLAEMGITNNSSHIMVDARKYCEEMRKVVEEIGVPRIIYSLRFQIVL